MKVETPSQTASSSDSTSLSLVRLAQRDDADAWQRLTKLYGPVVYEWARRADIQPHDAADVTQEVFQSLAKGLKSFRKQNPGDSFRGWLWTVTRNKVLDHFRLKQNREEGTGGSIAFDAVARFETDPPSVESISGRSETAGVRRRVMEQIKQRTAPKTWTAFYRTTVEDDAPHDVAEDLGMSVWAVYKARSRIIKRLRDELTDLM